MKIARMASMSVAVALVAGCATNSFTPTVISAGERSVTYRIPVERLEEARKEAEKYCRERGRTARLESVSPAGGERSVVTFACS